MADVKQIDEIHKIHSRRGNGLLRREVWVDAVTGEVSRYNLAYINHRLYSGDHGRVVGYDNAHDDGHHRHYFGVVEPVECANFDEIEQRFEQDWTSLRNHP
ncbi:MAG: DUF6516 family protein [Burkholderiaceae bacterium]|nr:DUF6516 family protein [Burkholderiaceae bacterium]